MTSPQNQSAGSPQLGQQARDAASSIAEQQISKQRESATGALEQVAGALQMTGEHLRTSQQERIARVAEQASERVREFSRSIRGAQPRDLIRRVEDIARREPALFLGGAFALGLIAARFLKSSERTQDSGRQLPRSSSVHGPDVDAPYGAGRVGAGSSGGIDADEDLGASVDELTRDAREH